MQKLEIGPFERFVPQYTNLSKCTDSQKSSSANIVLKVSTSINSKIVIFEQNSHNSKFKKQEMGVHFDGYIPGLYKCTKVRKCINSNIGFFF